MINDRNGIEIQMMTDSQKQQKHINNRQLEIDEQYSHRYPDMRTQKAVVFSSLIESQADSLTIKDRLVRKTQHIYVTKVVCDLGAFRYEDPKID